MHDIYELLANQNVSIKFVPTWLSLHLGATEHSYEIEILCEIFWDRGLFGDKGIYVLLR